MQISVFPFNSNLNLSVNDVSLKEDTRRTSLETRNRNCFNFGHILICTAGVIVFDTLYYKFLYKTLTIMPGNGLVVSISEAVKLVMVLRYGNM